MPLNCCGLEERQAFGLASCFLELTISRSAADAHLLILAIYFRTHPMANILYGVNGEGAGHSTRAKEVISHLRKKGHAVTSCHLIVG